MRHLWGGPPGPRPAPWPATRVRQEIDSKRRAGPGGPARTRGSAPRRVALPEYDIPMAKDHPVKQGEHLSGIAEHHGFHDYKTVWEDGSTAALSGKRNPHVLQPGDVIKIPDKQAKQVVKPTTQSHPFQLKTNKLFLRVKVLDLDFNALKGSKYEAVLAAEDKKTPRTGTTDKDGILKEQIKRPVEP